MARDNIHIVQKVSAVLSLNSEENHAQHSARLAQALQRSVERLTPLLDRIPAEDVYRIQFLSIDINLHENELEKLEEKIEKALKDKIGKIRMTATSRTKKPSEIEHKAGKLAGEEKYKELLIHFLKNGEAAWWATRQDLIQAKQWLSEQTVSDWLDFMHPLVRQNPKTLSRYLAQWPKGAVNSIIKKLSVKRFGNDNLIVLLNLIYDFLNRKKLSLSENGKFRMDVKEILLADLIENREPLFIVKRLVQQVLNISERVKQKKFEGFYDLKKYLLESGKLHPAIRNLVQAINTEDLSKKREKRASGVAAEKYEVSGESTPIRNAGMVILHNYLAELFKRLGYLENGMFRNQATRERAVCAMHFLASGESEFPEEELVLPKFLCSWPMQEPINRYMVFSGYEKEECMNLLGSVIHHWKALKNTSADGLRKNFLQREGILRRETFGWNLYVERETRDILLDQLPWGFSVIKLSWLDEMLTVQWSN